MSEVEDIDSVVQSSVKCGNKICIGEVVGVVSCTEFLSCITCKAKVNVSVAGFGICSKCGLKQKVSCCETNSAARIVIVTTRVK